MKNLIPWLCAALFGVAGAYYYSTDTHKGRELSELHLQAREAHTLRNELESARATVAVQSDDLARLEKESDEVVRLRTQKLQLDRLLKTAQNATAAAQQEVQQLRAALDRIQATAKQNETAAQQYLELQKRQMLSACLNQLRQIDLAKQEWAMENKKSSDAKPTQQDIALYLRDHVLPVCPAGGTYDFGTVEKLPTCSVPGHVFTGE